MTEIAAALFAATLWGGAFLLLTLLVRGRGGVPSVLVAYPLFFAFQVVLAKTLSLVGMLSAPAVIAAYGIALVAGGLFLLRQRRKRSPGERPGSSADDPDLTLVRWIVLGSAAVVLTGLALFTLVAPVHIWDVLAYHLPMVASYVQNGSLEAWATQDLRQVVRVNAGELQMLNVALLSGSDAWVELPSLLGLGVVLVASFELARLAFPRRVLPWLVVALVLTAPQIVLSATTAKNDLPFTAVLLAAFYWTIRAGRAEPRETVRFLFLAALCGALAAATKVMGLSVLGATGLLALGLAVRKRLRVAHVFAFGAMAALALLVLAGDVYLANATKTAVPVGIAPGEVTITVGPQNIIAAVRYYGFELGFKRLVIQQVFEHDFAHFGYFYPFLLALGIVGIARQVRRPRYVLAALAILAVILFVSVIALRLPIRWDQRFMIWIIPVLAVFALSLRERLAVRYVLVLTASAASFGLMNLLLTVTAEADGLFDRAATHLATTRSLARYVDVPNRRYLFMNDGFEALDEAAAPGDSVLYVGTDDSWMYPAWGPRFTRRVDGVADAPDASAKVAARSYRFVVLEDAASPSIHAVVEREIVTSGYRVLTDADGRTIFARRPLSATD